MNRREDWIKGFKFGFTVQRRRDRLIDFLAGLAVGAAIAIFTRWIA